MTSRWNITQVSIHILTSPPFNAWGYYFTAPHAGVRLRRVRRSLLIRSSQLFVVSFHMMVSDKLEKCCWVYVWRLLSLLSSCLTKFWPLAQLMRSSSLSRSSFWYADRNGDGEFDQIFLILSLFLLGIVWRKERHIYIFITGSEWQCGLKYYHVIYV